MFQDHHTVSFPGIVLTTVATAAFGMLDPTSLQLHYVLWSRSSSVHALGQDGLKVYEQPKKLRK